MTEAFKADNRCHHLLPPAAYEAIRFKEIVIVIEEKPVKKKKKPAEVSYQAGHRYCVVTDHHLFILPLKGKFPEGSAQPLCWLEDIKDVEVVDDGAAFLVPDVEKHAVHMQLEYVSHLTPRAPPVSFDLYSFIKGSTLFFFLQQAWKETKLRYNYDDPTRLREILVDEVEPSEWGSSDGEIDTDDEEETPAEHAKPALDALRLDLSKAIFFQGTSSTHDPHGSPRDPHTLSARLKAAKNRVKSPRTPVPHLPDRVEREEHHEPRAWIKGIGAVSMKVVERRRKRLAQAGNTLKEFFAPTPSKPHSFMATRSQTEVGEPVVICDEAVDNGLAAEYAVAIDAKTPRHNADSLSQSTHDIIKKLGHTPHTKPITGTPTIHEAHSPDDIVRIARAHNMAMADHRMHMDAARQAMTARSARSRDVSHVDTTRPTSIFAMTADVEDTTFTQTLHDVAPSTPAHTTSRTYVSKHFPNDDVDDGHLAHTSHTSQFQSMQAVFHDISIDVRETTNLHRRALLIKKLSGPLLRHRAMKHAFFESEGTFRIMVADMIALSEDSEELKARNAKIERDKKVKEQTKKLLDGADLNTATLATAQELATLHTPLRQTVGERVELPQSTEYPSPFEFTGSGRVDGGAEIGIGVRGEADVDGRAMTPPVSPLVTRMTNSPRPSLPSTPRSKKKKKKRVMPMDQTIGLGGKAMMRKATETLRDTIAPIKQTVDKDERIKQILASVGQPSVEPVECSTDDHKPHTLRVVRITPSITPTERVKYATIILDTVYRSLRNSASIDERLNMVWQPTIPSTKSRPTLVDLLVEAAEVAIKYGDFARHQPVWVNAKGGVNNDVDPYEDEIDRQWRRASRSLHLLLACTIWEVRDLLEEAHVKWTTGLPYPPPFVSLLIEIVGLDGFEAFTYGIVENCVSIVWRPFPLDFVVIQFILLQVLTWICEADGDAWETIKLEHEHAFRYLMSNPEQHDRLVDTLPVAQDTLVLLKEILSMFGPISRTVDDVSPPRHASPRMARNGSPMRRNGSPMRLRK